MLTRTPNRTISNMEKHDVVYSFNCNNCEGVYVGQTGQLLKNRIKQHKSDMERKSLNTNSTGAVQHVINTGHTFNLNQTKILAVQPKLNKRLVMEALYINKNQKNSINIKADIDKMNPIYTQLLNRRQP